MNSKRFAIIDRNTEEYSIDELENLYDRYLITVYSDENFLGVLLREPDYGWRFYDKSDYNDEVMICDSLRDIYNRLSEVYVDIKICYQK